ncbi:phosphatase PAP2 family protein [Leucobacter chinensis]|uniref:phosphatase PAP2 family protein n=1 Tax=Leucobacter chinensis TaxID=2851010 RepID=UPI001C249990|nr:phosphatase PAP2 family protein [Leucobacter chinensis]
MNYSAPPDHETPNRQMRSLSIKPWIIGALLVVPVAAAFWFAFGSTAPLPFDEWWHERITAKPHSATFSIANVLHVFGSTKSMAIIAAVLTIFLIVLRRWREAATIATTMIGVLVIVVTLKFTVERPRPVNMLVEQGGTSFPSGHSLAVAALFTSITCIFVVHSRKKRTFTVPLVVTIAAIPLMMWSRTALNVHWLSDTLCGALFGIALALVVARALLRVPEEAVLAPGEQPRQIA